jgi:hypothetical protein
MPLIAQVRPEAIRILMIHARAKDRSLPVGANLLEAEV